MIKMINPTGHLLKERRKELGLTQKQISAMASISEAQYQKFEADTRNLMTASFYIACSVLRALSIDFCDFYDQYGGENIISIDFDIDR